MNDSELMVFLKMLPNLYSYFDKQVKTSLLVKIMGVYTLKIKGLRKINVMVMQNAIQMTNPDHQLLYTFDLKGSLVHRRSLPNQGMSNSRLRLLARNQVLKDQDLIRLRSSIEKSLINFRLEEDLDILSIIKRDAMFLTANNLMDYSLLLAVEKVKKTKN